MNNISFLKKFRVKFILYKLKKLGLLPRENFIFSPILLFQDVFAEQQVEPINKIVLNKIIYQIKKHLNIKTELSTKIDIKYELWKPYLNDEKPIKILKNKVCVTLYYLYNYKEPEKSCLNIDESAFIAILCKEMTRYYLEENNIHLKSELYIEMAMCLMGVCKEADISPSIYTFYNQENKLKKQTYFVASQQELSYAKKIFS